MCETLKLTEGVLSFYHDCILSYYTCKYSKSIIVTKIAGIVTTLFLQVEDAGLINHPPWKLKVIRDSKSPTWHDGPGAQWGWKDNLYTHAYESYDR